MVKDDDDAVVVVIDDAKVMTMEAAGEDDDPQYHHHHHSDHMVINQVSSKFLGFSFWSAAYIILHAVGTIILYWDVNKVGIIVSVILPILVTCLLILWVHTFAVKLIDSCLINPNPVVALSEMIRNDSIEKNVSLRYFCTIFCPFLQVLMFVAQHGIRWDKNDPNLRVNWVLALSIILFLVSYVHRKWICLYLDEIVSNHLKNKIKQPQPQPQPLIGSINSTPSTPTSHNNNNINQTQPQQQQQSFENDRLRILAAASAPPLILHGINSTTPTTVTINKNQTQQQQQQQQQQPFKNDRSWRYSWSPAAVDAYATLMRLKDTPILEVPRTNNQTGEQHLQQLIEINRPQMLAFAAAGAAFRRAIQSTTPTMVTINENQNQQQQQQQPPSSIMPPNQQKT